jgi:hypothetical protein
MGCYAAGVALAGLVAAAAPATADARDVARCVSAEEADAFQLRALQNRLMVAALSCNQQSAYNTFVERFQPELTSAGRSMQSYYRRTGGGDAALNRHMTELANAAGLLRAKAPDDFCGDAWTMFLLLQDEPMELPTIAAKHELPSVETPHACPAPVTVTVAGAIKASAP